MNSTTLLKGTLQTIVLKLLQDNDRMYGYEITKVVKEMSDGAFVLTEGALYPALHKLEGEGLLTTTIELFEGRARKYYSLTPQGRSEAHLKVTEAATFIEKFQFILNLQTSTT